MKFKRGDLVSIEAYRPSRRHLCAEPCIVLGGMDRAEREGLPSGALSFTDHSESIWYKVYMIGRQDTYFIREGGISTMNPQEAESEV